MTKGKIESSLQEKESQFKLQGKGLWTQSRLLNTKQIIWVAIKYIQAPLGLPNPSPPLATFILLFASKIHQTCVWDKTHQTAASPGTRENVSQECREQHDNHVEYRGMRLLRNDAQWTAWFTIMMMLSMHLPCIFSLQIIIVYFCVSHLKLVEVTDASSLTSSQEICFSQTEHIRTVVRRIMEELHYSGDFHCEAV